jgi:hypothetical protein
MAVETSVRNIYDDIYDPLRLISSTLTLFFIFNVYLITILYLAR